MATARSDLLRRLKQRLHRLEKLAFVSVFAKEFDGFSARAMLDDAKLEAVHIKDFVRRAVVAENGLLRQAVIAFGVFFPAEIRTFRPEELDAARLWAKGTNA
ncbi:MAG: SpoIIAA family protein [Paracoccaceae bacterium]